MSMNNSIMAGVGQPLQVATAVRIPLQGPFNTLVVVHLRAVPLRPGVTTHHGEIVRSNLSFPSNFILVGFDQRSPPVFQHSTAGFLSYIATGNDATFTYAIDTVSARFDETGRYWLDYSTAMMNDRQITSGAGTLTSWVLVNEPAQEQHGWRHSWVTSGTPLTVPGHFGLPLAPGDALQKLLYGSGCD